MKEEKINSSDIFTTLGSNIRKVRLVRGLSQENLSNDLDKTLNFISLVENGKTGISVPTFVDICNSLNINPDTLLDGIVPTAIDDDKFILNTIHTLEDRDKKAVIDFLNYIIESKNLK